MKFCIILRESPLPPDPVPVVGVGVEVEVGAGVEGEVVPTGVVTLGVIIVIGVGELVTGSLE